MTSADSAWQRIDDASLRAWPLPMPHPDGDKESRGRVLIVAGCGEMPGAAILTAEAALRAGAGKVVVATACSVAAVVAAAVPEIRVVGLRETADGGLDPAEAGRLITIARRAGALLIGPGMQEDETTESFVRALVAGVRDSDVSIVLDAAAMGVAARSTASPHAGPPMLITPHAGEMAKLSGVDKSEILRDAGDAATQAAQRWHAIVALKGARTVIAHPDGRGWSHEEAGNVGLATAGSGDVLAGLIAGFAARGAPLEQAAAWGAAVHARAGERVARRIGSLGYLARELAAEVPSLLDALCGASA